MEPSLGQISFARNPISNCRIVLNLHALSVLNQCLLNNSFKDEKLSIVVFIIIFYMLFQCLSVQGLSKIDTRDCHYAFQSDMHFGIIWDAAT